MSSLTAPRISRFTIELTWHDGSQKIGKNHGVPHWYASVDFDDGNGLGVGGRTPEEACAAAIEKVHAWRG